MTEEWKALIRKEPVEIAFRMLRLRFNIHGITVGKDCHQNARILCDTLNELGFDATVKTGAFINRTKVIRHSWVEAGAFILETDPEQLGFDALDVVLDREQYKWYYNEGVGVSK